MDPSGATLSGDRRDPPPADESGPVLPEWLVRLARASAVRFCVGFGAAMALEHGGELALSALRGRRPRRRAHGPSLTAQPGSGHAHAAAGRRAFRVGAWAAATGASYAVVRRLSGSPALAGAVAGSMVAVLGPLRGTFVDPVELSLHAAVRAAEHVLASATRKGQLPAAFREHGATLVFVAACTQIMFSWFYQPEALPRSYAVWIDRMAQMDTRLLTALRQLRSGRVRYGRASPILRDYCLDHHLDPRQADLVHGHIPCSIVHPRCGESCVANLGDRAWRGALAALLVYVPVHALAGVVALVPKLLALQRDGSGASLPAGTSRLAAAGAAVLTAAARVASNSARSSAFLGLFIGLAWYGVCLTRNAFKSDLSLGPFMGSFLAGWAILLEPRRRRAELAMFTVPRALHAAWFGLKSAGLGLRDVPFVHVALAAAAGAVLVPDWERHVAQEAAATRPRAPSKAHAEPAADGATRALDADHGAAPKLRHAKLKPLVRAVLWLLLGTPEAPHGPEGAAGAPLTG